MVRKYFRNIPVLFFGRIDGIAQPTGQSFRISKNDGVCNGACHKVQKTSNFGRDTNFKNQTADRSNSRSIKPEADQSTGVLYRFVLREPSRCLPAGIVSPLTAPLTSASGDCRGSNHPSCLAHEPYLHSRSR